MVDCVHRYIVVEGVIGVGKTTLARLMARKLHGHLELEEVETNPFLKDFYEEHYRLYRGAPSMAKQLATLRRYRLRDVPRLLALSLGYQKRLRAAYRDYETAGAS